jgi:hypothetical protein
MKKKLIKEHTCVHIGVILRSSILSLCFSFFIFSQSASFEENISSEIFCLSILKICALFIKFEKFRVNMNIQVRTGVKAIFFAISPV